MRYLLVSSVILFLTACESEYDSCFKETLKIERERYTCYDLWQECEASARNRAAKACKRYTVE